MTNVTAVPSEGALCCLRATGKKRACHPCLRLRRFPKCLSMSVHLPYFSLSLAFREKEKKKWLFPLFDANSWLIGVSGGRSKGGRCCDGSTIHRSTGELGRNLVFRTKARKGKGCFRGASAQNQRFTDEGYGHKFAECIFRRDKTTLKGTSKKQYLSLLRARMALWLHLRTGQRSLRSCDLVTKPLRWSYS